MQPTALLLALLVLPALALPTAAATWDPNQPCSWADDGDIILYGGTGWIGDLVSNPGTFLVDCSNHLP